MSLGASVEVSRPQRWDEPFGERPLSSHEVERILSLPPFRRIDQDAFPPSAPLREIVRNDTRIGRYAAEDVICRKGDPAAHSSRHAQLSPPLKQDGWSYGYC